MVDYHLDFTAQGKSSLASLDKKVSQRVLDKLKWFIQHIDSIPPIPLYGTLLGLNKLRVGDWRVFYEINKNDHVVTVHKIGHRKDVYR